MIVLRLYFTFTVIRAPQVCSCLLACLLVSCPFCGGGGGGLLTFLLPSPSRKGWCLHVRVIALTTRGHWHTNSDIHIRSKSEIKTVWRWRNITSGSPPKKDKTTKRPSLPPSPPKIVDKAAAADFVNVGERAHGAQTSIAYQVTGKRSAANGCGVC